MTVKNVLEQIEFKDNKVISKSTGIVYEVNDFIEQICSKLKFNKRQRNELESFFTQFIKNQTEDSKYVENIIEKYDFKFADGVYTIKEEVIVIDDIYRLLWREERLLPVEADRIIENIEKISEIIDLQEKIFIDILKKAEKAKGKSKYLNSLYCLYPEIKWIDLLYNIIVPKTIPLFHIFYDDGVGGTGKSTLLEVLTKIVGQNFVSNVLLDQFGNRFIFANMLGKYLNIGDDNGKNDELQNVGTLKSIITGNRVTIDRKNISPIEVRIFAKQLFATNILPYIDFTDGGIMRRLNIVKMNKVIPKEMDLCKLDEQEIANLIGEVIDGKDLTHGDNDLAITCSTLYRFYTTQSDKSYESYKEFCNKFGFFKMNIINFEVKSKFIKFYIIKQTRKQINFLELEPTENIDNMF